MVTEQEYVEPSESMKAFLSGYCYAGICWVCGARLKEKGATVCPGGAHKSKDRKEEEEDASDDTADDNDDEDEDAPWDN